MKNLDRRMGIRTPCSPRPTRFGSGAVTPRQPRHCAPPPPTWGGDRGGGLNEKPGQTYRGTNTLLPAPDTLRVGSGDAASDAPHCAPPPPTWGGDRGGG